jgi:hypothetical protein
MLMRNRLPLGLVLVAILQFIPLIILPPTTYAGIGLLLGGAAVVLMALLGVSLLRRQAWSRMATIFVQGFNIIVRILIAIGHVRVGGHAQGPVDGWLLGTFTLSILLSAFIIYYVDLPDVQVLMQ